MKKIVLVLMLLIGSMCFACKDPGVHHFGTIMEGETNDKGEPLFRVNPGIGVYEYRFPQNDHRIKILYNKEVPQMLPDEFRLWGDSRVIFYSYFDKNGNSCAGFMDIYGNHIKSDYDY